MEQVNEITFQSPEEIDAYLDYCTLKGNACATNIYSIIKEAFAEQGISYSRFAAYIQYDHNLKIICLKYCEILSSSIKSNLCSKYDVDANYVHIDINHLLKSLKPKTTSKTESNLFWHLGLKFNEILRLGKHCNFDKRGAKKNLEMVKDIYYEYSIANMFSIGNSRNLEDAHAYMAGLQEHLHALYVSLPEKEARKFAFEFNRCIDLARDIIGNEGLLLDKIDVDKKRK
ncbi:MAG: hypothetical protein HUJ61_08160 [Bacilli bacterium]|nr:hypothetical protein [Bacilli bacterium]